MADSILKGSYLSEELQMAAHKVDGHAVAAVIREQHIPVMAFLVRH